MWNRTPELLFSFSGARLGLTQHRQQCAHSMYVSATVPCCPSVACVCPSPAAVCLPVPLPEQKVALFPLLIPRCSAAALCAWMWCCVVVLAGLQADIPTFPMQATNSSYYPVAVLLFFSICTLAWNFPVFRALKFTQLPFLLDFWCLGFFSPAFSGFFFNHVLTLYNSYSLPIIPALAICNPAWITFCATLILWTCQLHPSLLSHSAPASLSCVCASYFFFWCLKFLLLSPSCTLVSKCCSASKPDSRQSCSCLLFWKAA